MTSFQLSKAAAGGKATHSKSYSPNNDNINVLLHDRVVRGEKDGFKYFFFVTSVHAGFWTASLLYHPFSLSSRYIQIINYIIIFFYSYRHKYLNIFDPIESVGRGAIVKKKTDWLKIIYTQPRRRMARFSVYYLLRADTTIVSVGAQLLHRRLTNDPPRRIFIGSNRVCVYTLIIIS